MAKNKGTNKSANKANNKHSSRKDSAPAKANKKSKQKLAPEPLPAWEQAYERGNYAAARTMARQALQGEHAQSAQAVLDKISVDKIPLIVFAVCLLLISSIAFWGLK